MNPRDMDAFYDAILAYTGAKFKRDANIPWIKYDVASNESPGYLRTYIGSWYATREDELHATHNAWLKDITHPIRKFDNELPVGDTSQIDSFLAEFVIQGV